MKIFRKWFSPPTTLELAKTGLTEAQKALNEKRSAQEHTALEIKLLQARITVLGAYLADNRDGRPTTYTEGGFVPSPAAKT